MRKMKSWKQLKRGRTKKCVSLLMGLCILCFALVSANLQIDAQNSKAVSRETADKEELTLTEILASHLLEFKNPRVLHQEDCGLPENAFFVAELRDKPGFRALMGSWEAIKAADGNFESEDKMLAAYETCLFDMMMVQMATDESFKKLTSETDFDAAETWLSSVERALGGTELGDQLDQINDIASAGEVITEGEDWYKSFVEKVYEKTFDNKEDAVKAFYGWFMDNMAGEDDDGDNPIKRLFEGESSPGEIIKGMDGVEAFGKILEVVSDFGQLLEKIAQMQQLQKVVDMKYVLEDMRSNISTISYDGLMENEYEKLKLKEALDVIIDRMDGMGLKEICDIVLDETMENSTDAMVNKFVEGMWGKVQASNPYLSAVKVGLDIGIGVAEKLFNPEEMFGICYTANAQNYIHKLAYQGMLKAEEAYERSRTPVNAELYVNYIYLLNDSYFMLVDNYDTYVKTAEKKYYEQSENLDGQMEFPKEMIEQYGKIAQITEFRREIAHLKPYVYNMLSTYYECALAEYEESYENRAQAAQEKVNEILGASEASAFSAASARSGSALSQIASYRTLPAVTKPSSETIAVREAEFDRLSYACMSHYYGNGGTLDSDMTTYGNVTLAGGTLDLNGHTLTVYGDFRHSGGQLNVNHGTLIVKGDYLCRRQDGWDSKGTLKMKYDEDKVFVEGDYETDSYYGYLQEGEDDSYNSSSNVLWAGTIEVKGNFTDESWYYQGLQPGKHGLRAYGTHKVVFSGNKQQTISAKGIFNQVEFQNSNIAWEGAIHDVTLLNDITLSLPQEAGYPVLNIDGVLDLNGHTLTINGDVMHTNGQIFVNKGTLHVTGTYAVKKVSSTDGAGNVTFRDGYGTMKMKYDEDKVLVEGDYENRSTWSYLEEGSDEESNYQRNVLWAGTIEVKGNFTEESFYNSSWGRHLGLRAYGTHKVVFSGDKQQTVSAKGIFNQVEFQNSNIAWEGAIHDVTLLNDITLSLPQEAGYQVLNIDGVLDLNGHTLTINGDVMHTDGQIFVNKGTLHVTGTYAVKEVSGTDGAGNVTFRDSEGTLKMKYDEDKVLVEGDYENRSTWSYLEEGSDEESNYQRNVLWAGTIEVKGNFTDESDYRNQWGRHLGLRAYGTHVVHMKGDNARSISLPNGGKFNILQLDKPLTYYTITPENCWNELWQSIMVEPGTGGEEKPAEKKVLSANNVTLSQTSCVYDGKAKKPAVTVKYGTTVLKEGTDYTVAYQNNINVGTAKVIVTGKGNYTGTVTKIFAITKAEQKEPKPAKPAEKKSLSAKNVTLRQTSYAYNGKAKKPSVTVKDGKKVLKSGKDYTVTYQNNKNAGKAKVIVKGKGDYKGTVTKTFTITVKKNTSHKVGSYQYKVTGTSTVSMTAVKNSKMTKVKVPKTVKIGGKNFRVTAIGSSAFKKNKKITSVEIGDNVKVIGAGAFDSCTKLGRVTVGKGVTEIGKNTFKNCKKLENITIKSTKLKKVGVNALRGIKSTAKIKVPAKQRSAYQKLFKNKGQGKKVKVVR